MYAFHVESEADQAPEHPILAELAEVSQNNFFGNIAECVERGTAQKRGTQRAILPQALAIRLATRALDRLPPDAVLAHFNQNGRERLFRSFTRRLGDLHQSESARRIAHRLLAPTGMLGDLTTFADNDFTLFLNIAPVDPELALVALERAIFGPQGADFAPANQPHKRRLTSLARNLAYEADYFDRAARVLLTFAKEEAENYGNDEIRSQFFELFWIRLSGTQASPEQRYRFFDQLLVDGDDIERVLAVEALSYALDTHSKVSSHSFQFGSRRRGEEWRPRTIGEQNTWYREALSRLVSVACRDGETAARARSAIAGNIRGLVRIRLANELVGAMRAVRESAFWAKGWRALCEALYFDRNNWPQDTQEQLDQLEGELRPATIDERFSTYVLGDPWGLYPPNPEDGDRDHRRISHLAEEIGQEIGPSQETWPRLAREACAHTKRASCADFGRGLGKGVNDVVASWAQLVTVFGEVELDIRNSEILSGFLAAAHERDPDAVQRWLDQAVANDLLGPHIVDLSVGLPIDRHSIARLTEAVRLNISPLSHFHRLSNGGCTDTVPPDALADFLRELSKRGGEGAVIAADILNMSFFARLQQPEMPTELLNFGRELLQYPDLYQSFPKDHSHFLETIAGQCLAGGETETQARAICETLLAACQDDSSLLRKLENFVRRLAELHLSIVLDVALGSDENADVLARGVFGYTDDDRDRDGSPSISENSQTLMEWANENLEVRAVRLARYVRYAHDDGEGDLSWSSVAKELINLPEVSLPVLGEFYRRFFIGGFSGPWHVRLLRRRLLLESLPADLDPSVRAWTTSKLIELDADINELIRNERHRDERFE